MKLDVTALAAMSNSMHVPLSSAPMPIQDGQVFYIEPNQADFDVMSVVYDVEDVKKEPYVVVNMPYWTRSLNEQTGVEDVWFRKGVNVKSLSDGGQTNIWPVARSALLEPAPVVPQNMADWIRSLTR